MMDLLPVEVRVVDKHVRRHRLALLQGLPDDAFVSHGTLADGQEAELGEAGKYESACRDLRQLLLDGVMDAVTEAITLAHAMSQVVASATRGAAERCIAGMSCAELFFPLLLCQLPWSKHLDTYR
ncbi:hypothetical protein LJR168_003899 [Pseudoxanthomonas sp. LjRoot168]|uniref:hypothetical protein n=1 Tax=unclassified Pseudoxanthomonas TaxID=2645906 RepID=UPI003ECDA113